MKQLSIPQPEKHVFICVNERDGACCKSGGAEKFFLDLKSFVLKKGLNVWVSKAGCLGLCNPLGPNLVVYPEGKWFLELEEKDLEEVFIYLLPH